MSKEKYHLVPEEWLKKQLENNLSHRETFDDAEENDFVNGEQSAFAEIKSLFPSTEMPNEWISGHLPQDQERVLFIPVKNGYPDYEDLRKGVFLKKDYFERENIFCDGAYFSSNQITHWMSLPSPPNK